MAPSASSFDDDVIFVSPNLTPAPAREPYLLLLLLQARPGITSLPYGAGEGKKGLHGGSGALQRPRFPVKEDMGKRESGLGINL